MISVIVPVYNTVKFLPRCIDSILAQTYIDFEAIFVDDGSTDESGEILDNYEKKDARIKVFHQTNQGATKARAFGVGQAKGEWITFVDSDDMLPEDALQHYSEQFSDDTDIVIGWLNQCCPHEDFLPIEEYRRRNIGRYGITVGPPTHTFRKTIIPSNAFDIPREITMGEDVLMNIRIAFNTEKAVRVTHHFVYCYNVEENQNNATNNFSISMEYEHLYHQYRLNSIPLQYRQLYIKEMVGVRLYDLFRYLDEHPLDRSWKKTLFYKELKNDIDSIGYNINKANVLLLSSNNWIIQYLIIQYKNIRTKLMTRR